ncbi:MAG: aminotransferase class IV, partial [Chloroflexi bacterium]|nr:aminotransferase class IV [Chloroflexota bacterium]
MNNGRTVFMNGHFVPETEARVSVFDSALVWGDMVFETTRSFAHRPFKLREHLERLHASMIASDIDCGMTLDELEEATDELVRRNEPLYPPDVDFTIVHNMSPGVFALYA